MSGGRWNYEQEHIGYEMYPGCDVDYGLGTESYRRSAKLARRLNPLEDKQLSELAFDLLCVIHSADWYKSGDTGEEKYRKDIMFFKDKWLKIKPEDAIQAEISKSICEAEEELLLAFGLKQREE